MTTLAILPGTFDPPTLGHLSILRRAAKLFDQIVVLVAVNPDKETWFKPQERAQMWTEITADLANVTVEVTDDLVAAFASRQVDATPVLIRGIRSDEDLEFELLLAGANRELGHGLETVFFPPGPSFGDISSTVVRERLRSGESVDALLHPRTTRRVRQFQQGCQTR